MKPTRHAVIVVGGGQVGGSLALGLWQQGVDVALVEAQPPTPFSPADDYGLRMSAIAPAAQQWLAQLGVWSAVADSARACAFDAMHVWECDERDALSWSAAELGVGALGWIVENALLLHALWQQLQGLPRYCPARPASMSLSTEAACLTLQDGRVLQADLLVAADGANSSLRRMAGILAPAQSYAQQGIVANIRSAQPHQHTAWQRFLPTGPLALLPLADGRCSIVWSATRGLASELLALDDAAFAERLTQASGRQLGAVTGTGPRAAFPLQRLHAQSYVAQRFALVGDAAHVIHPLAGQGVNLGYADARLLTQQLTAVHAAGGDLGADSHLHSYARARRADNTLMLATTDALARLFAGNQATTALLRRRGLRLANELTPIKQRLARQALG